MVTASMERVYVLHAKSGKPVKNEGFIVPPDTISVTFSRVYIRDNLNYCLSDAWFIDSIIVLPPGNHSLIMNFSGPSLNSVYYGYIQYLFAYYNGTNIANNYTVKFNNLTYLNNNSSVMI
ncbi:unnamed protein product [Schistosoma rodhaini]|uniref:Uncharacterized protein n=1 Tax=Schistosoma rodhaini TaxID=6188 RepID=A0AA85G354_9TREM|nr:unnamed protein product [Schistosoma rodhaini]